MKLQWLSVTSPLHFLCSFPQVRTIHSSHITHRPLILPPLSLSFWHVCITAYLTKLTHRGVQWVVQLEHDPISMDYPPWMMQQSKFDVFFLAGWRSWTLYSFQMKCLYCITLLRLTFTDWHTNQACCQLCEKCDSFGKSPSCSFDKFLTIHLISPLTFSPPLLQIWVRPGVWQLSWGLLWQVLPESYAWQPIHLTACLCVTGA